MQETRLAKNLSPMKAQIFSSYLVSKAQLLHTVHYLSHMVSALHGPLQDGNLHMHEMM